MTAKRYAVADKGGKIINHILVGDPLPKGYWPGYGAYLIPLEPVDTSNGGGALDIIKFDKMSSTPQIGDTISLATGVVTKFVPKLVPDPTSEELCSSAPEVKFAKDEEPKAEGTITQKVGTEPPPKEVAPAGKDQK